MTTRRPIGDPKTEAAGQTFRGLLRHWRTIRCLSQLALAEETQISTRHLSFLETGRSRPSRDMVERLAESLDIPFADRNVLLLLAGYAPTYPTDEPETEGFESHERMFEAILSQQRAIPSLVIDEDWNIRMRNTAAARLFGAFRPLYRLPDGVAGNALHILCHPGGLRQFMPNWTAYAEPFVQKINSEASMGCGDAIMRLRDELHAYPGIPVTTEPHVGAMQPLLQLQRKDAALSFHTTFTTFVLPSAYRPRQIKIESLFPADKETAKVVEGLVALNC